MKTKEITNRETIIDTRDVLERIEYLADEVERLTVDDEELLELASLACLIEETSAVSGKNVEYGAQLIRDSYFRDFAQEMAEDCAMIPRDAHWPNNYIDWDEAARELQMDYSSVEFSGVEYWVGS
jgi:antirestriction protein